MRAARSILLSAIFLLFATFAGAVEPGEMLDDPALEARARALSEQLRCMVCQNQSIDSSDAELARDLRLLVRERLVAGDTDQAVLDYVVSRYGEFVLLKPRISARNSVLWLTAPVVLVCGAFGFFLYTRRRPAGDAENVLSEDEERRIAEILDQSAVDPHRDAKHG
jgi:cytochrome c-type biogenesis protein CcmH